MVGEVICGRFRIERRIGSGGFGTVYRAWDERLERPVAVKVFDSSRAGGRVTREAQAVARLAHRNIATLYELADDGERAFLVSELIEGETLRSLGRGGRLSDRLVAKLGADCAAALSHAHRNGVVHRDVKPENVMATSGADAKLVDFGIASIAGERTLTRTGDVLGTLGYMAPEQAEGQRPGPAADVYALALTLYESLCGEHPRLRESPAATARAIAEEVPPLGAVRPDLPEVLTDTIDACLDLNPEARPLASELEGTLSVHVNELDGEALPAVEGPGEDEFAGPPMSLNLARVAPAASIAGLALAALLWSGAPGPVLLAAPAAGAMGLVRPRPAFALALGVTIAWLLAGAGEPGTALILAVLGGVLLIPAGTGAAVALPSAAPALGIAGVAAAYPALAGLARGPGARALLGMTGYLWLAATEIVTGRTLLLGPETAAPDGWRESAGVALGEVILPVFELPILAVAGVWALAALALPLLVRGRTPVLDLVGALIWAAALVSAHRLVAGPADEPGGLFLAAVVAAGAALVASRRLRQAPPTGPVRTFSETGPGRTA